MVLQDINGVTFIDFTIIFFHFEFYGLFNLLAPHSKPWQLGNFAKIEISFIVFFCNFLTFW
jgi:hypothetical protein